MSLFTGKTLMITGGTGSFGMMKGTGIVALLLGTWLNYCHCGLV